MRNYEEEKEISIDFYYPSSYNFSIYKKKKKSLRNDRFLLEGEEKFGASIDQFFNRLQIYSGIFIGRSIGREPTVSVGR